MGLVVCHSSHVVLSRVNQGFRNRKSAYTTALDCYSANSPRAPGQRPSVAEQPPGAQQPPAPPTESTRDSSPHTAAVPVYYDHDHEVRAARNSMQLPRPASHQTSPSVSRGVSTELPGSQVIHDSLGLLVIQRRTDTWAAAIVCSAVAVRSACRTSRRGQPGHR